MAAKHPESERVLTVGELRAALEGIADDTPVLWFNPGGSPRLSQMKGFGPATVQAAPCHGNHFGDGEAHFCGHLYGPYWPGERNPYPHDGHEERAVFVLSDWRGEWMRRE